MAAWPHADGAGGLTTRILWQLFLAPLRVRPGRSILAVLAIALGVALATAVAVIHRSAQEGLADGLRSLGSEPDVHVVGGRDDVPLAVYAELLGRPEVRWVAPVVEREMRLVGGGPPLPLLGIDSLALPGPLSGTAGLLSGAGAGRTDGGGLLRPATVLLSADAAERLALQAGDRLAVVTEHGPRELEILGVLPAALLTRPLAVADIATAHVLAGRPDRLSRLDVRLAGDSTPVRRAQMEALQAILPAGLVLRTPEQALAAADRVSRAYRINLAMLALMALLTGAFLVFAVQASAMLRRRHELGVLRALGMSRRTLFGGLMFEGGVLGLLGSVLGVLLGVAGAVAMLRWTGGDLGAGYFAGSSARLTLGPAEWAPHLLLGITAALAGAWLPAAAATRTDPARALRAGDAEDSLSGFDTPWLAVACAAAGGAALLLPPVDGVPWGGYLAIASWLSAAVFALPVLARRLWWHLPLPHGVAAALALAQLRGAARLVTIGAGGVLAATAVAAAMGIMVTSFRASVDRWLADVLVADVYLRAGRVQTGLGFDAASRRLIEGHPDVRGAHFVRYRSALINPARPPVTVIARPLPDTPPAAQTRALPPPTGLPAVWVSEAMADLYGWTPGRRATLPLAGRQHEVFVAGIWRDYVRSHGALLIDLAAYQALTGDQRVDEAGLLLRPAASADALVAELRRALPIGPWLEAEPRQALRARSLAIFDRTFAATYALELAALFIGLAGVAASFAAQASGRLREFGMLRHLGLSRRQLQRMVAIEAAAVAGAGLLVGLVVAFLLAVVLIEVINRQSFHWGMTLVVPWGSVAGLAAAMLAASVAAALFATRGAFGSAGVRAVREDW